MAAMALYLYCRIDSFRVLRQSFCGKFQIVCGFWKPAKPAFRMYTGAIFCISVFYCFWIFVSLHNLIIRECNHYVLNEISYCHLSVCKHTFLLKQIIGYSITWIYKRKITIGRHTYIFHFLLSYIYIYPYIYIIHISIHIYQYHTYTPYQSHKRFKQTITMFLSYDFNVWKEWSLEINRIHEITNITYNCYWRKVAQLTVFYPILKIMF